eukprot:gene5654-7809_t
MAVLNNSNGEYECMDCSSSFVEEINQGHESFQSTQSVISSTNSVIIPSSGSRRQSRASSVRNHSPMREVMDRVMEFSGSQTHEGRPVGMIIRHVNSSAADLDAIVNLLSMSQVRLPPGRAFISGSENESNSQLESLLHHILMNETSLAGAPAASEELIANLERETVTTDPTINQLGDCCISQELFEIGDVVITLSCGHRFKEEPIIHWLKMHNTCPVCRITIN